MAKERTEKSKYLSGYGGGYISAHQLLAEQMCEKQAKKDGYKLQDKFWEEQEWVKRFRLQAKHASKLLEDYSIEVILEAFKHWRLKNIYSLGARYAIDPICSEISKRISNASLLSSELPKKVSDAPIIQRPKSNGLLNKMRDL